jgi:hypothetical protein
MRILPAAGSSRLLTCGTHEDGVPVLDARGGQQRVQHRVPLPVALLVAHPYE